MGKKIAFGVLAVICLIAAFWMKNEGETNGHLTELKDYWYVPLPLALVSALAALTSKSKT